MANKKFSQFTEDLSLGATGFLVGYDATDNIRISLASLVASFPTASSTTTGLLSSSNWSTFNSKEPAIASGTTSQYWRGDKSWQTLDKSAVGLSNVENTALSTWAGSVNITTLGTIVSGTWNGNAIGDSYISSAATWNAKLSDAPSDGNTYGRKNGAWSAVSSGGIVHGTASGTDTYTVTIAGVSAYADGDAFLIRFPTGNTTASTLNINSLGARTLYRNNDGPIVGGDIVDGAEMLCVYNSTSSAFQCIGTSPNSLVAYVTNADSVTITKGQPVYAFGGTGDRLTVKLALNTSDATSAQTVGLVMSTSIAAGQKGFIIVQGLLDGLSIVPTPTWADGDPVYLGATAGTITNVKPSAPNHLVYLGTVTTASPGAAGRIYVRVQNGYELQELHNVQLTNPPANNDGLFYETSTSLWKNKSIPTVLGYTPQDLSLSAYSLRANNTNVTANAANHTFRDSGLLTYTIGTTGAVTWSGTTPPSGTANHSYQWVQVGKMVTLRISLIYGTAGSALTQVTIGLPSDCPTPQLPTGVSGASANISFGTGWLLTSNTSLPGTGTFQNVAVLRINAANNGYDIITNKGGGAYNVVHITLNYFAQ